MGFSKEFFITIFYVKTEQVAKQKAIIIQAVKEIFFSLFMYSKWHSQK